MIVISARQPGVNGLGFLGQNGLPSANSVAASNARSLSSLASDALRTRIDVQSSRGWSGGLGAFDTSSIPMWAWAAGGGLLGGIVVGALVFRKKRK